MKLIAVAGARPNFMKIAPLVHELRHNETDVQFCLVHTGQHYDYDMSKVFFDEFDISEPDYFLEAGSGSHAVQTAKIMREFEGVCLKEKPDLVLVVGDVNSTLACSVTAKKLNTPVAHVEAGLRSGDRSMPEEINRIVTDSISDLLFVTEESGMKNLKNEGKKDDQIFFVGNIMIDSLHYCLKKLGPGNKAHSSINDYAVVTLHRPSNVDHKERLGEILEALSEISKDMPVYFPIHPRTEKNIDQFKLKDKLKDTNIELRTPMSYFEFLALWRHAKLVLTDSGGLQEETTALGVPCFTLRDNTERPITIDKGSNTLVGATKKGILDTYYQFKSATKPKYKIPDLWDGKTAARILDVLRQYWQSKNQ